MKNKILLVFEDYTELVAVESTLKKIGFDTIGLTNEYSVAERVLGFNPDLVVVASSGQRLSVLNVGKKLKEMKKWTGKTILCFTSQNHPSPQDLIQMRSDHIFNQTLEPVQLVEIMIQILDIEDAHILEKLSKYSSEAKTDGSFFVEGHQGVLDTTKHVQKTGTLFQDVNIEELEKELYEGKIQAKDVPLDKVVPASSGIDLSVSLSPEKIEGNSVDILSEIEDLKKAQAGAQERLEKYQKYIDSLTFTPGKGLDHVESRKKQKEMTKSWDVKLLEDLDKQRRNYVKALFKK